MKMEARYCDISPYRKNKYVDAFAKHAKRLMHSRLLALFYVINSDALRKITEPFINSVVPTFVSINKFRKKQPNYADKREV